MKVLLLGLVTVALLSTVSVSASPGDVSAALGCAESISLGWGLDSAGQLTAVEVTWIPGRRADYRLEVTVEGSTGSLLVANSSTTTRTDSVSISPHVATEAITSAKVCVTPV